MANFNDLFDQWAPLYDQTVYGVDNEYVEVFENYRTILQEIGLQISPKGGTVLEVGVGTGNLSKLLIENDFQVVGVEPSYQMRMQAKEKVPALTLLDGHFLSIPTDQKFDSVVSSYALHHLTLAEKREAIQYLSGFLKTKGKLIIVDTMFESIGYKNQLLKRVESAGLYNLLSDLNTEYYELIEDITALLTEFGFTFSLQKMNSYVWMVSAKLE